MVNCPKCGTPNPDAATRCLACSAPLEGQKFAQALDRAQAKSSGSWPQIEIPLQAPVAAGPVLTAAEPVAEADSAMLPITTGREAPHVDVKQYLQSAQAKKRRARLTWVSVAMAAVIVASVFVYRSAALERRRQAAATFMSAFMDVDNTSIAAFWRCVVGAAREDIHRAKDNLIVTSGIERAFQAAPHKHPRKLQQECLPALDQARRALKALDAPAGFGAPLRSLNQQLLIIKSAIETLAAKMDRIKDVAASEAAILDAAACFHDPSRAEPAKAAGYVSLLDCAVPRLGRIAKQVKMPPDSQGVIEHIFTSCKDNAQYADTLRMACFPKLQQGNPGSPLYKLVSRRMAGDDRDIAALTHCFSSANQGLLREELAAVGKGWVEYRNSVNRVASGVSLYKEQAAGDTPAAP